MRLFENLDKLLPVLVFVAIALFNWWSSRQADRAAENEAEEADQGGARNLRPMDSARERQDQADAEAQRARRLQEEIRRRIAERRTPAAAEQEREFTPPPLPSLAPRPAAAHPGASSFPGSPDTFVSTATATARSQDAVVHENIMRLAQERQRLESETARVRAGTRHFPGSDAANRAAAQAASTAPVRRSALLAGLDLKDPLAARRAIVLAEILSSPVGMRPRSFIWEE